MARVFITKCDEIRRLGSYQALEWAD